MYKEIFKNDLTIWEKQGVIKEKQFFYCLTMWNVERNIFSEKKTHKPRQMCWGAAKGRALNPPWWAKLSPSELASTQMRLDGELEFRTFIPSTGLCQKTGRHRHRFERSKYTPPSCVEGQRQKVSKILISQKSYKTKHFLNTQYTQDLWYL